jgi:hypothetical protein
LVCSDELLHSLSTIPTTSEQTKDYAIVGVIDYECNSSSEQTKDYTIVGVVDNECNRSSEQTLDYRRTITLIINYTNNCIIVGLF